MDLQVGFGFFIFVILIISIEASEAQNLINRPPSNYPNFRANTTSTSNIFQPTTAVPIIRSTVSTAAEVKSDDLMIRINERLTALHVLNEQQLKRLESLEYKITRIEVTHQERSDALRADMRELARRVQNLDWLTTKTENTLDQMRNEVETIRLSVDDPGKRSGVSSRGGSAFDLPTKLEELSVMVTSARSAVFRMERDLQFANNNLTVTGNMTKEILQGLRAIPTKQFLNNAVLGLKSQPIYVNLQGNYDASAAEVEVPKMSALPVSCTEAAPNHSGVFKIHLPPRNQPPFYTLCEIVNNMPWMVIQKRYDGGLNFHKTWLDYVHGFGSLSGEFWLGLEKLHLITLGDIHELLIMLEDYDGGKRYAHYSAFVIGGEKEGYPLSVLGPYNGTAGDSLSYHAGHKFSTYDMDNDGWVDGNCAQSHTGAWWYNACDMCNLNGRYLAGDVQREQEYQGMYWNEFRGSSYSLKSSKMLIRPIITANGVNV